jgi:hypothetical protein
MVKLVCFIGRSLSTLLVKLFLSLLGLLGACDRIVKTLRPMRYSQKNYCSHAGHPTPNIHSLPRTVVSSHSLAEACIVCAMFYRWVKERAGDARRWLRLVFFSRNDGGQHSRGFGVFLTFSKTL